MQRGVYTTTPCVATPPHQIALFGILGGFFIPPSQAPPFIAVIIYANPTYYCFSAMVRITLTGHYKPENCLNETSLVAKASCVASNSGNAYVTQWGYQDVDVAAHAWVMVAFHVGQTVLAWVLLSMNEGRFMGLCRRVVDYRAKDTIDVTPHPLDPTKRQLNCDGSFTLKKTGRRKATKVGSRSSSSSTVQGAVGNSSSSSDTSPSTATQQLRVLSNRSDEAIELKVLSTAAKEGHAAAQERRASGHRLRMNVSVQYAICPTRVVYSEYSSTRGVSSYCCSQHHHMVCKA